MKTRPLLITAPAAALVTGAGAGFAFADNADQGEGYTNQDTQDRGDSDRQDRDQGTNEQGYSQHWFSPTGYGPNDDQAEATRALNTEQLGNHGNDNSADQNDDRS